MEELIDLLADVYEKKEKDDDTQVSGAYSKK
jgi:hypothetical protein